jgi:hypothetical protein
MVDKLAAEVDVLYPVQVARLGGVEQRAILAVFRYIIWMCCRLTDWFIQATLWR